MKEVYATVIMHVRNSRNYYKFGVFHSTNYFQRLGCPGLSDIQDPS